MTTATAIAPRVHRFSVEEYHALGDAGVFDSGPRVELIEGEVWEMAPQRSRHATGVRAAQEICRLVFGTGFDVRAQVPLLLGDSEPEPDVAVVVGSYLDYRDAHPSTAVLVIEVAETSLPFDRGVKRALYARHGIPEYWIVNLRDDVLEVHRDPAGDRYRSAQILKLDEVVTPRGRDREIAVRDLLP